MLYAYDRSKQKVQDKVGPLEGSGETTRARFLLAENINELFRPVFTREGINSLPVPEAKFEGRD